MGKVGDARAEVPDAEEYFQARIYEHKIFCFYRYGWDNEPDDAFREHHAEGSENPEDCPGGTKHGYIDRVKWE